MTRRFRHRQTQDVVELKKDGKFYFIDNKTIDGKFIEGSFDWQEIKDDSKELFISADNVKINVFDEYFRIHNSFYIERCTAVEGDIFIDPHKCYSSKSSAEQYVLVNKPTISLSDVVTILGVKDGKKPELEILYNKFKMISDERVLQNL
jgi:hypothetical protein